MMNRVILVGRITKDPGKDNTVKYTCVFIYTRS